MMRVYVRKILRRATTSWRSAYARFDTSGMLHPMDLLARATVRCNQGKPNFLAYCAVLCTEYGPSIIKPHACIALCPSYPGYIHRKKADS